MTQILQSDYDTLSSAYNRYQELYSRSRRIQDRYNSFVPQYNGLIQDYDRLRQEHEQLLNFRRSDLFQIDHLQELYTRLKQATQVKIRELDDCHAELDKLKSDMQPAKEDQLDDGIAEAIGDIQQ